MPAFVMKRINEVGFMDKPLPKPGPNDAIVRTTVALICTSDTHTVTRPGATISNVGYHGDGEYVHIPRMDWGVGMSDKTIRTALSPGGAERMKRLMRLIEAGGVDPLPLTTHRFKFCGKGHWCFPVGVSTSRQCRHHVDRGKAKRHRETALLGILGFAVACHVRN